MDKVLQNPIKSGDFVWISQFCAILQGFCLFWDSTMDMSR